MPSNEIRKTKSNSFLLFLLLILTALFISFGVFIYTNIATLKAAMSVNKSSYFREYLYPGYELLQD